jgi:multicomponent Na+:H+ antiporter subunit D
MIKSFPILVVIVPLFAALIIPLIWRMNRHLVWHVAVAACGASFAISLTLLGTVLESGRISYWLGNWEPPWGIEYVVDYLSGFVLVIVSFIALLVALYSRSSVRQEIEEHRHGFFYCAFMLFVTGLMGIIITGDIFNLYVFIEISALSGYVLIASGRKREALTASYNYLILGTIAATFILLGIGHLYMVTGSLNMADISLRLTPIYKSKVVLTAFALFTVGLSLKLALFPLHIWMPNAYAKAPSVVSALLAATSTKVGAYVLFRILFSVFSLRFDLTVVPVTKILVVISSVAIIAGSVIAIAQSSIKRMLAYSSVGQIGYIVLGAALVNQTAMAGSLIHILNHALMKGGLFLAAGAILYSTGVEHISDLRGMGRRMPVTMAAFTVLALSMIGVPLTVGFVSKWYLSVGALEAGRWYVVPVILLSSILTAVYFWRIIENIYFDEAQEIETDSLKLKTVSEAPFGMLAPTLVMAVLCVFFGVASGVPLSVARRAASMLIGGDI